MDGVVGQIDSNSDRMYAYSQLEQLVDNCATSLGQLGIQLGDRVCLVLSNCIEFPLAFLAVLRVGAVFVPVSPAFTKCTYRLALVIRSCLRTSFCYVARLSGDYTRLCQWCRRHNY